MEATVLIVDDDPDIRLTLRQILREEGFLVREARNGLEALEAIDAREPDLVLLDLMMPGISGWDVLETLKSSRRNLPVVILSAAAGGDRPADYAYIAKPVSFERLSQLLDTIRTRLDERSSDE